MTVFGPFFTPWREQLPIRTKPSSMPSPSVQIHPVESENGLIIKIEPPREPQDPNLDHVPCDIVLSIDVSGSMRSEAPVPRKAGEEEENYGLSVLDLVKHAAKTILETLDERDRLGIVTFSSLTTVLQPLTPVTKENKQEILSKIDSMKPSGMTNLWHGILDGLKLFNDPETGSEGRVPALLVLTDGIPNHMCPSQGYIPKLKTKGELPATIHTFGFGYELDSGLLKSISEIGGGGYSFIPDAGMIGTVFVHAVANLQSTFADKAVLRVTYPSYLGLEETTGEAVEKQPPQELTGEVPESLTQLTISLSTIPYGQSRDIFLRYSGTTKSVLAAAEKTGSPPMITALLEYHHFTPTVHRSVAHRSLLCPPGPAPSWSDPPSLSPEEIAYHVSRSRLAEFLTQFYPLNSTSQHSHLQYLPLDLLTARFPNLAAALPAFKHAKSPLCASLLSDLCGPDNLTTTTTDATSDPSQWNGQVALALSPRYFNKWGKHYLPSLATAYSRQACNSFKDHGPLLFGAGSPLFQKCRARLDEKFDNLPAPVPTCAAVDRRGGWGGRYFHSRRMEGSAAAAGVPMTGREHANVNGNNGTSGGGGGGTTQENSNGSGGGMMIRMERYNDRGGSCFAGFAKVKLADGSSIRVGKLRRGMAVITPVGPRRVVRVLRTEVRGVRMSYVVRPADRHQGPGGRHYQQQHHHQQQHQHQQKQQLELQQKPQLQLRLQQQQLQLQQSQQRGKTKMITMKRAGKKAATGFKGSNQRTSGAGLLVTPWHPISFGGSWVFPKEVEKRGVRYTGGIYSILLEKGNAGGGSDHGDPNAHAVLVDGIWGVTMGHGILTREENKTAIPDVRAHEFFGNWDKVYGALSRLRTVGNGGLVLGGGVTRDRETGLVDGFMRADGVPSDRGRKSAKVSRKRALYG